MSIGPQFPRTRKDSDEWEKRYFGEEKRWHSDSKKVITKKDYERWKERVFWIRLRWEFMRRSSEYLRDFERVQELRQKYSNNEKDYQYSPEYSEELKFREKYKVGFMGFIPGPEISFDELTGGAPEVDKEGNLSKFTEDRVRHHAFGNSSIRRPDAVNFRWIFNEEEHVTIEIDFSKVNQIGALKKYLSYLIDEHSKRLPPKKHRNNTDYELFLQVGDMRDKKNLTFNEIAKKIEPNKDLESAVSLAKQHYKSYKKLINGGYDDLTFP